jgi:hypothetical protein
MARRTAMFSLLPSVKRDWIKALRSGKYRQTRHILYDQYNNGFCCLGVLCAINGVRPAEMTTSVLPQDVGFGKDITPTVRETPKYLRGLAAQEALAWSVLYKGKLTPLHQLNDYEHLTFHDIADIIEKNVPTHRS